MMNTTQDRAMGQHPWLPLPPEDTAAIERMLTTRYTRDDPYYEAGNNWWIEGNPPYQKVFLNGVQVHESEYPDPIWDEMRARDPNLK